MSPVRVTGRRSGYHDGASGGGVIALAGQTADAAVVEARGGFVAEFDSALGNLLAALGEAGGAPADLLGLRVYVTDLNAYVAARGELGDSFRRRLDGHYPAMTLVEVGGLLGGAQVEIDGLAAAPAASSSPAATGGAEPSEDAVIRLRLAPADARYAGGLAAGSKAMEIFADLETELALREGGDEGLCVAYDMVEFLAPLRVGDFVEGRARVVSRGRSSRRITAEIHKVLAVDEAGVLVAQDEPILAVRASVTIVVGRTPRGEAGC
ncbi:MAG TPA: Rid family hydrolase [Gaiellaceae bacterium]|nr:Rid family hydrolase [Gaiellaceae bacterium]